MTEHSVDNKRIAKNTLLLYFRMILMTLVGLFTSRIILHALGASDLGVYNVVGGIVAMFGVISNTMSTGSMRFIATAIGKEEDVQETFSAVFFIHLIIAVITFLLLETIGLWFLYNKLNIPDGRMNAAIWVLQFSSISCVFLITQIPYNSCIIAHEKMGAFAYLSIIDAFTKLFIALGIKYFQGDRLILYGFLMLAQSLVMLFIYRVYAMTKFKECHIKRPRSLQLITKILSFSGWNTVGTVACMLNTQGVSMLFNMFFGTVINAAINIANQINDKLSAFVNNFQMASNPQIVKLYASGDLSNMYHLAINTSKFSGYIYMFFMIPFYLEMDVILKIWLGYGIPNYTLEFAQIVLIQSMIINLDRPFMKVLHAVGKLRTYSFTAGGCLLLALPVDYVLLKNGANPTAVYWFNIVPWIAEFFIIIILVKRYTNFGGFDVVKEVMTKVTGIFIITFALCYLIKILISNIWLQFLSVITSSTIALALLIYYFGLNAHMRSIINAKAMGIYKKYHK